MQIKTFVMGGLDNNCYVLWDEQSKETAIVDSPFGLYHVADYVKENDLTVKWLLLTHGHYDHIDGIETVITSFEGIKTVLSENEREFFKDHKAEYSQDIINVWAKEGDTFKMGNKLVSVIETPGHTPGSVCYKIDDMLFSGDTLFKHTIGRCDLKGGDYITMQGSLLKLMEQDDSIKVYPGHGDITTIGHERRFNPYTKG